MDNNRNDHDQIMSERSILSRGDISRIARCMKKAMAGEPVKLGFMGGSITNGGCASSPDLSFASLVTKWWKDKFPHSEITGVNAGIPGTGSLLGAHRIYRDLLVHRPDFVIVEFAVNDFNPMLTETYDSMVRRILLSPNDPGVMLLHMTNEAGGGAEALHSMTGVQYDLPMISFKNAVWPELESGDLKWLDFEADTVHPNDRGHGLIARFITDRLEEIFEIAWNTDSPISLPEIQPPLNGDWYRDARILQSDSVVPVEMDCWDVMPDSPLFSPGWKTSVPGKPIIFEFVCRNIGFAYLWSGSGEMGGITATIDDGEPVDVQAHTPNAGAAAVRGIVIGKHLPDGLHRMKIEVNNESVAGGGHNFVICALLVS